MHLQLRTDPSLSPPDLEAFLTVLADAGINIVTAGGSNVEFGGEFAIGVEDNDIDAAVAALERAGYKPRVVEIYLCWMTDDKPGQLLRCVTDVSRDNASSGRKIRDIAIGVPDDRGHIPVQIFSE